MTPHERIHKDLKLCREGLRFARKDAADFPSEATRRNLRIVEECYADLVEQYRTTAAVKLPLKRSKPR